MYAFRIKADASDIAIPAIRSLLALAAFITVLYMRPNNIIVPILCAVLFLLAAIFSVSILIKYRLHPLALMASAAIVAMIGTQQFIFPVLMFGTAWALQYAYVHPTIELTDTTIRIHKTFNKKQFAWADFNNVILKDGLLTLDFKTNKLLQLEIEETNATDEVAANNYFSQMLTGS